MSTFPVHIVHVIHALKIGGLENGLVNLIQSLPADKFRHTIISLTDHDDFAERIDQRDVVLIDLHKKPGQDPGLYLKLYRVFRSLKPDIVHTRNLSAIEAQIPAALAGVPVRIHGEHGRDQSDPDGTNKKYQWLRRLCAVFIHRFVALSAELESYLMNQIGIPPSRISRICNGVDTERFNPSPSSEALPHPFAPESLIIGYVGRMDPVKAPLNLVRAFIRLHTDVPNIKLVMIGEGVEREKAKAMLQQAGLSDQAWLPGAQISVSDIMRSFDIYVLPSIAEGISNTLLEAMATGLPVIATRVGGNRELVSENETGLLIAREETDQLVSALERYLGNGSLREAHASAGRCRAEQNFSLDAMVKAYGDLYLTSVNR